MIIAAKVYRGTLKNAPVAKFAGNFPHKILQPLRGLTVALEVRIASAYQVRQDKCLHLWQVTARGHLRGHLAAAVAIVRVAPYEVYGFFAVEERNPHRVLPRL